MKVSEAIEKLTNKRNDALSFMSDIYKKGDAGYLANEIRVTTYNIAINTLQQIDEPQGEKVEVPDYVAEWYESHRGDLEYDLFATTVAINNLTSKEDEAFEKWFDCRNTKPYETIIKMKLFGYTVKPKRWVVKVGNLYFCGWEDTTAQFVMNTALGEDESIIKYKNEGTASSVAKNLGGTVEKVLVEGSVEEV